MMGAEASEIDRVAAEVSACIRCERLVEWRRSVAVDPPKRFRGETYWARGVPGFGDPAARIVVVGLAPAANGANRTGRMFTGDRSGDWLYAALHRAGLANQPESVSIDDGLKLSGVYVTAAVRCAPPANKPTPAERDACSTFLAREFAAMPDVRAIVALGAFGWNGALLALAANGVEVPKPRPKFGHGAEWAVGDATMIGSYHVSQQNTFTGRLTEPMLDAVFARAKELASRS